MSISSLPFNGQNSKQPLSDLNSENSFSQTKKANEPFDFTTLGLSAKAVPDTKSRNDQLGHKEFMTVFVAQMQHQNPLEPQEGAEFISQLAQFSSVESLEKVEKSIRMMSESFYSNQTMQASSLVGTTVAAPGVDFKIDENMSKVEGIVDLPAATNAPEINVIDGLGKLVKHLNFKEMTQGSHNFIWDGKDETGETAPFGNYRIQARAIVDGETRLLDTALGQKVVSVSIGSKGDGLTINLSNGNQTKLSNIREIS